MENLEKSLAQNRPRALIQMATGSGKTFTAASFIYRLIQFAGAKRVLFLVDRARSGQTNLAHSSSSSAAPTRARPSPTSSTSSICTICRRPRQPGFASAPFSGSIPFSRAKPISTRK
ncbi:MAG: DEAD/DEAH box helicase family protein [Planctomycetota bacterium]